MVSTRSASPVSRRPATRTGVHSLRILLPALALLIFALAAPAAQAGKNSTPAGLTVTASCEYTGFEQPFANWGDSNSYLLAPGGSFESGAPGWTLSGAAAVESPGTPIVPESSAYALS